MYNVLKLDPSIQIDFHDHFEVSFYVPCLNEEKDIYKTLTTLVLACLEIQLKSFEILAFDDGSTDSTYDEMCRFKSDHPEVAIQIIRNSAPRGLGRNFIDAAFIGKGKHIMIVFGDSSEPSDALKKILTLRNQSDMVIVYLDDQRVWIRRTLSKLFTFLVNKLSGRNLPYYNGPNLHKRANIMRWHSDTYGFAYQAEVISRVLDEGASFVTTQIVNEDRSSGVTKAFHYKNILSVSHSLFQILLRRIRKFIFKPSF